MVNFLNITLCSGRTGFDIVDTTFNTIQLIIFPLRWGAPIGDLYAEGWSTLDGLISMGWGLSQGGEPTLTFVKHKPPLLSVSSSSCLLVATFCCARESLFLQYESTILISAVDLAEYRHHYSIATCSNGRSGCMFGHNLSHQSSSQALSLPETVYRGHKGVEWQLLTDETKHGMHSWGSRRRCSCWPCLIHSFALIVVAYCMSSPQKVSSRPAGFALYDGHQSEHFRGDVCFLYTSRGLLGVGSDAFA